MYKSIYAVLFLFVSGKARELTDAEKSRLPRMYELDEYKSCLAEVDGLYCFGTIHLTPTERPHDIYELMEEHSSNPYYFNRTLIRRGWCLSARDAEKSNAANIFENRAKNWAKTLRMNAKLHRLQHCRTYHETKDDEDAIEPEQKLFVKILLAILAMNIVGTVYDHATRDSSRRNKLLLAWSMSANWNKLTAIRTTGDPRLPTFEAVQGFRILCLLFVFYAHVLVLHYLFFVANPEALEQLTVSTKGIILSNGSNLVHMFLILTSYMTTYNLLLYSEKKPLELRMLPLCIYKRIIRITPVYALVMGYGATWYARTRTGPMTDYAIKGYSATCVKKFWTHIFYLNNVINKEETCLMPSWYLAVDMHLYILTCLLTLLLWRYRQAKRLYTHLFFGFLFVNFLVCYIYEYKPLVFLSKAEAISTLFEKLPSFWHYYISTWGALPSCFAGLYFGHLQYDLLKKDNTIFTNKALVYLHNISFPLTILWAAVTGTYTHSISSRLSITVFMVVDKIVFIFLSSILVLGLINIDGPQRRFFAWSGWQALGRMSLCVMLCHWCVGCIIAAKPYVYEISDIEMTVDWIATVVLSYAIALPVTVLVEYPFQKFFETII
ncbi:nose resistant to fluoxetine protein 6 [Bombyx mori]|uniref:Acyltransferase 3 domain-containing protein n=1 Tax=Bombyx mori TaxID=7091 RepID=A0A8R2C7C0_BOMMO|nr:nose resistant to fluoxetine protein 6-like [Bombyx mori]